MNRYEELLDQYMFGVFDRRWTDQFLLKYELHVSIKSLDQNSRKDDDDFSAAPFVSRPPLSSRNLVPLNELASLGAFNVRDPSHNLIR